MPVISIGSRFGWLPCQLRNASPSRASSRSPLRPPTRRIWHRLQPLPRSRAGRLPWGSAPRFSRPFPGANSVSIWPTGYISYRRPGEPEPFVSPDDGLGIALLDLPWIKAGPVARFISERTLSGGFGSIGNNDNFFGLHNVGFTAELGGFLELWPTDFIRARLEARQGVSGAQGFDANIELDLSSSYGAFTFAAGPRFQFGDDQFMSAYFSVTPAEAFLNGNVFPYQAMAVWLSVGGLGSIKYTVHARRGARRFLAASIATSAAREEARSPTGSVRWTI